MEPHRSDQPGPGAGQLASSGRRISPFALGFEWSLSISDFLHQQGLEAVRRELPPPASEEFGQVVREISLGVDTPTALNHLVTRMRSYDLDLMVTAITVQRQVGGNLAEILDNIAETVRERVRLLGEVRALTGEVRISAW